MTRALAYGGRRSLAALVVCLGLACAGQPAYADFSDFYAGVGRLFGGLEDPNAGLTVFPTLLVPLGGKYEGMGTAYTALAWDSGFIEANPAGSAVLENSELSFLHHNWIADSRLEGVIYTFRLNDLGIGFGGKFLYLPFTEYGDWAQREAAGIISETVATANISYNLFPSYDFYGLAVGMNLKAAYRYIPDIIYPGQSAVSAMADLGLLTRFNLLKFYYARSKNFSLGAVVKNVGLPALDEPLPSVMTAGIGYSPVRPVTVAVDLNVPFSLDSEAPPQRWYVASGIDVTVTPFLSIQGGFRVKENPQVSVGSTLDLGQITFTANYNLDLSGSVNPVDKFSIEAKVNLGDSGRASQRKQVDELYASGLEYFARGEFERAISEWEAALKLDPHFKPADEAISTAQKRLDLQKEMIGRQQNQ
jgi:hypothetical protein